MFTPQEKSFSHIAEQPHRVNWEKNLAKIVLWILHRSGEIKNIQRAIVSKNIEVFLWTLDVG